VSLQAENQAIADRGRRALADAEGVLQRLEDADQHTVLDLVNDFLILFWNVYGESNLFRQVYPDPAVRSTAEGHLREALRLRNQMHHSPRVFELLESLEESQLEPLAWRAAALTRRDMRRFGVNLSAAEREHVRSLRDELNELEQAFARNIRDDVRGIQLSGSQALNGLPADYLASHAAGPDGQVRITTSYPDYYPFMNYARSEDARIALVHEFYNRAVPSNLQVLRAMVSLSLHDRNPADVDPAQLVFDLADRFLPYQVPSDTHFEASFDHLTNYSAAYYTYLWSQVIARDLLNGFTDGLLDPIHARRYRDRVLVPGGTKPAAELVADFLGRPYAFDAFAAWLGSPKGTDPP
jgi:Zn-dependent oligopeptidase